MLRFTRLPARALKTVRAALDSDEGFRSRVAEGASEQDLGRASWLFLTRPEGWEDEFELLASAANEELEGRRISREEQRAERRAAQLAQALERQRAELAELREQVAEGERSLAAERSARLDAETERDQLVSRVAALDAERSRAVKELKDTEAVGAARLGELRDLRAELDAAQEQAARAARGAQDRPPEPAAAATTGPAPEPPPPERSPWQDRDADAVAEAVRRAGVAADALAAALADAARSLQPTPTPGQRDAAAAAPAGTGSQPSARPANSPRPTGRARPPRRTPVRLRRGVHEDSVEGLEQLLGTSGIVAVVDGYNVSKEGWPALEPAAQRESLIAALGVVRSRLGPDLHVVFDGDADGLRPSVSAPLPVRVHFSPAQVEADDVILEMVAGIPTDVPVAVVSSDRRVADGARRLGANAVRSRQLLELVRR